MRKSFAKFRNSDESMIEARAMNLRTASNYAEVGLNRHSSNSLESHFTNKRRFKIFGSMVEKNCAKKMPKSVSNLEFERGLYLTNF